MSELRERHVVDRKGRKVAVVIPIKDYRRLLEDLHDLAVVAERRDDPPIRLVELRRRLRAEGLWT